MLVDGNWTNWTKCSKSCDGGNKTRTCTNPKPQYGGKNCTGHNVTECNIQSCPGAVDYSVVVLRRVTNTFFHLLEVNDFPLS